MMKKTVILLAALFATQGQANYTIKSPYLQDVSRNIEYIRDQMDFFIPAKDTVNGGFFSYWIDQLGRANTHYKGVISHSLLGYGFCKVFMATGDETYLQLAHHALQFLYDHGWDQTNGGWFWITDENGIVTDPTGRGWNEYKESFVQQWALAGIAAICEATGGRMDWSQNLDKSAGRNNDKTDMDWLLAGENWLDEHMWDDRSGYEGYYQGTDLDGNNPWGKGYTPTMEGIPTHFLPIYRTTLDDRFKTKLIQLGDITIDRLMARMDDPAVIFGFPGSFDTDWNLIDNYDSQVGSMLKTSLCLAQIQTFRQDANCGQWARRLMLDVWQKGYDHTNGAPYTAINWLTGYVEKSYKDFWTMDMAIVSGLVNYYLSSAEDSLKDISLQMADESLDFYMNHFRDTKYGGVYWAVTSDGTGILDGTKGNNGKCGYHETELAMYAYLYGGLILHNQPVSLYYYFQPKDISQSFTLTPMLTKEGDKLRITNVTLDGVPFTNYNAETRTLFLWRPGRAENFA